MKEHSAIAGGIFARNAAVLLTSSVCSRFVALGFNVLLARFLGVEEFGLYAFAISFMAFMAVVVEFSLHQLIIREVARNKSVAGKYFSNALLIKSILFLVASGIAVIAVKILGYSTEIVSLLSILAVGLLFEAVTNCCIAVFNGYEAMQYSGAVQLIEECSFIALGLASLALGGGVFAIAICRAAAQALTQVVGLYFLRIRLRVQPGTVSYEVCKDMFIAARHFFGVSSCTTAARNLDTMMLLSLQNATAVGIYVSGAKLGQLLVYLSKAFSDALYPVLSRQAAFRNLTALSASYQHSLKWLVVGVVPFLALAAIHSRGIMTLIYGARFSEAAIVFHIFAWRAALALATQLCGTTLFALGRQRLVFCATAASALLSVGLFILLIPRFSYTGAALATLAALVLEFSIQFSFIAGRLKFSFIGMVMAKLFLVGLGLLLFFRADFLPLIPLSIMGGVIYLIALFLLRIVSREELETLLRFVRVLPLGKKAARTAS
jgi:O-antigen/teichoic acid export membrane protein